MNIIIKDEISQKPDKVGVYDNSLPFDVKEHQCIGHQALQVAKKLKGANDKIFICTMEEYRRTFVKFGSKLGVANLHPDQLRHGGATQDLTAQVRDFNGVKSRGRWKIDSSVRRYTKVGRVQQLLNQLPESSRQFCRWSYKNLAKSFSGMPSEDSEHLDFPDIFTLQYRPHRFALEIFTGNERINNALNKQDIICFPIDNCIFPFHNVLASDVENKIFFWIRSDHINFI